MAEDETERYREFHPSVPIRSHSALQTIGAIRQAILDSFTDPCIVMIDDDLKCVRPLVGARRKPISDPMAVWQIILNGFRCAADGGFRLFAWNRNPNPAFFRCADPFRLVAPCTNCFGVIGRGHRFDETLIHGEDADFTMQALQNDRIVLQDQRFYFDFGLMGEGSGGLQGRRSDEKIQGDIQTLAERWGRYLDLSGAPASVGCRSKPSRSNSLRIKVSRKRR